MISHSGRRRVAINPKPQASAFVSYEGLLNPPREAFARALLISGQHLFSTDADGLYDAYLKNLPKAVRQEHACSCCRQFIERFGSLVAIDENGHIHPALWPAHVDGPYAAAFSAMHHTVKAARVMGIFLCKEATWGVPETPGFSHLSVSIPTTLAYHERALTAGQKMAERKQDFVTVKTALVEFAAPLLDQAIRLFDADAVSRAEKFAGPVKWLRALHDRPKGKLGDNVLWREIAAAPAGFCHPKSSVIGPLLEDIRAGKPFAEIKASFEAMLHPLRYQRPQAAPAAQNIERAEALIENLGYTRSLERRFARLDEVEKVWEPEDAKPTKIGGVFGHLKAKSAADAIKPLSLPAQTMSMQKFVDKILPGAEQMQFLAPSVGNYSGMLTAEHADAPVIHKWGNSVSWYVWCGGSSAAQWGLTPGWVDVTAIIRSPSMWGERLMPELGFDNYLVALKGAADTRDNGNALFPETLIGGLFGVRSTIEAYSRSAKIGGRGGPNLASGHMVKGQPVRLRAFANGAWSEYLLDRWD